jgi:hypothetical protein
MLSVQGTHHEDDSFDEMKVRGVLESHLDHPGQALVSGLREQELPSVR